MIKFTAVLFAMSKSICLITLFLLLGNLIYFLVVERKLGAEYLLEGVVLRGCYIIGPAIWLVIIDIIERSLQ